MLTKSELESYTTFKDSYQIEKDYLQDMLLYELYSRNYVTNSFVFKGGTSLSKFHYSNRFSEDLDFTFAASSLDVQMLSRTLELIINSLPYRSAFAERPSINKFGTICAGITVQGPRYNGKPSTLQHLAFEINTAAKLLYKPVPMVKKPPYKDVPDYTALVMDSREVLAEKVRAVMSKTRKHKERDFYDMYFLFGKGVKLDGKAALKKMKESETEFSKGALERNINEIEKTWGKLEPFLNQKLLPYGETRATVVEGLRNAGLIA